MLKQWSMRELIGPSLLLTFLYSLGACAGHVESTPHTDSAATATAAMPSSAAAVAGPLDLGRDATSGETDPRHATRFYVWSGEVDGHIVTHELDTFGRQVAEHEGVVIATRSGTWKWEQEVESVPTTPCEYQDDEGHVFAGDVVEPGTATRGLLRHREADTVQVAVENPGVDLLGYADVQHSTEIMGSVGPYVFIKEWTYAFGCGAHGNTHASTHIWNVATGAPAPTPTDLGNLATPRALAIADLTDEDDEHFAPTEENLELTCLAPRFEKDGALVVGLQFTAPTCYACSRGDWDSYTKSTVVDAPAMPEMLAPFASAPAPVRAFLRARPDVAMRGWSAR
jgi:hypothetical protein